MKTFSMRGCSLLAFAVASALVTPAALAQDAEQTSIAETDGAEDGPIVVTARKRGEDILRVPVAVSALTSEEIEKRGVVSVADIASNTPGLNVNNSSNGRADRSFQTLVLRGFAPATTFQQTTSVFIDGVPVSSPTAVSTISDVERIEVIKGPQSAYFGRNTFAGALNVVNKVPSSTWTGSALVMAGTRSNYRLRAALEGPVLDEALTFRVTGERFAKDGSYVNPYDGGTLGDQASTNLTATFALRPLHGLTVKLFGLYAKDDDGAPASGRYSPYTVTGSNGTVLFKGQQNCTLTGNTVGIAGRGAAISNPYVCGTLPALINRPSANTLYDSYVRNYLANPRGRLINPGEGQQGYGLTRELRHVHMAADWAFADAFTFSLLAGLNHETISSFSDIDGYDTSLLPNPLGTTGGRTFFDFPYLNERFRRDHSVEGRLAFDGSGPLSGTVGVSYLRARSSNGLGGGNNLAGQNGAVGANYSQTIGDEASTTIGGFFGLTYKFDDRLSASVEGRYQTDTLFAFAAPQGVTVTSSTFVPAGTYAGKSQILKSSYKNFLPRLIVNYQATPDLMVYGSVAKGVNPGNYNTNVLTLSPAIQTAAAAAGVKVSAQPEKVTNFELGVKGRAIDGRLRFSLAAYYSQWRDQINNIAVTIVDTSNNTVSSVSGSDNTGSLDLRGLELDASYRVNRLLSIDLSGAINDSSYNTFVSPVVSKLTGVFDFKGKEQPFASKYSATVGVQLADAIRGIDDADWFVRADYSFKSGLWANQANITRTPDFHLFNLRAGVSKGHLGLDLFVRNVFDVQTPISVSETSMYTPTLAYFSYTSALVVGLPERRTAGVQLRIGF